MEMTIDVSERHPGVSVVRLSGRMGLDAESQVQPGLLKTIDQNTTGVLVDMNGVSFISSAGLRVLMIAFKQAAATGRKVAVIRPQPEAYKMFKLANVETLFNVHETEEAALQKFGLQTTPP